jgi:hypothetical protein
MYSVTLPATFRAEMKRRSVRMFRAVEIPRLRDVEPVPSGKDRCGRKVLPNVRASVVTAKDKHVAGGEQKRQMLEERDGLDLPVEAILQVRIKAQPHTARGTLAI